MLDAEEFKKEGKTPAQIVDEAIKGPLLTDYINEANWLIMAEIRKCADAMMPIAKDETRVYPSGFATVGEPGPEIVKMGEQIWEIPKGAIVNLPAIVNTMTKLQQLVAACKGPVSIDINDHRTCYQTIDEYLQDSRPYPIEVEPEIRAKMVELDTIVEIQFYPHTPIGFHLVVHFDIEQALDEAFAMLNE